MMCVRMLSTENNIVKTIRCTREKRENGRCLLFIFCLVYTKLLTDYICGDIKFTEAIKKLISFFSFSLSLSIFAVKLANFISFLTHNVVENNIQRGLFWNRKEQIQTYSKGTRVNEREK